VDAKANNAMNEAFFILAGYIFGGNRQKRDIAMTAPVVSGRGKAIAMTAPVALAGDDSSALTMRFFLPATIRSDNAPEPNDPRVRLVEVPEETVAALRFTGTWGAAAIEARGRKLVLRLRDSRWSPIGKPFTQLYDPPFTIPWLRRNEVAVRVAPRS
jgi:hypothetical protein